MAKAKNPKYTTPRAVASYPYFNKPDEFKGDVRYKAELIVDREEAAPLMAQCEEALRSCIEKHNKQITDGDKKGKKLSLKKALANGLPWEDHEDDEDKIVIKVKQNAEVNGEKVTLTIYDSKGKRIKKPPIIRGGSVVKVAGTIRGYEGFGGGVTLSISAVQVIELSQGGSDLEDGSGFGFGEEEEGFEADESAFQEEPEGFEADEADEADEDEEEDF